MAKNKEVYAMAEELGIKKENLELGLKANSKGMEEAIKKAHDFKFGK